MTTVLPRVPLSDALTDFLGERAHHLPSPWLSDGHLRAGVAKDYAAVRTASSEAQEAARHLRDLLDDPHGEGYAVLDLVPVLDHYGLGYGQKAATIILSWLGTPIRAYDHWPLWRTLNVDMLVAPVHATAPRPLHLDAVNAVRPPDYTAIMCVRPDPFGGGYTLVSQVRRAVDRLSGDERALLAEEVFYHEEYSSVTATGGDLGVFPVLDERPPADGFVRFHSAMPTDGDRDDPHTSALRALERELIAGQSRFRLAVGELLVVNQHLCAHGREALGSGQTSIPEEQRLMAWQTYLRAAKPET